MKSQIVLTPRLFRKLDRIVREQARVPLQVVRPQELPGAFAGVIPWAIGCYEHDGPDARIVLECPVVCVSNVIDLSNSSYPYFGIMWRDIPREMLYEFLIWHEIAHVVHGDALAILWAHLKSGSENTIRKNLVKASEVRAQRYAWEHVFPDVSLPESLVEGWEKCLATFEACDQYYSPLPERPRIPLTSNKVVPSGHRQGIPFHHA